MKKKVSFTTQGQRADIGEYAIQRILPNRYADAVGPFVFLDHILPATHSREEAVKKAGTGAHPHRGIATVTYLLHGEAEHFDSRGHHAKVASGGVQWMKAGNGIIHDEVVNADPHANDGLTHGFQFWISLPSRIKAEAPEYRAVLAKDIPQKELDDKAGWIKVIVGQYEDAISEIPMYSKQFLYHLHLEKGKRFSLTCEKNIEYAAFLPLTSTVINDESYEKGEFIEFDRNEGEIEVINDGDEGIDVIIFGGERYTEPIVAKGPFVMNSELEIAEAYRDYYAGKYGKIEYGK